MRNILFGVAITALVISCGKIKDSDPELTFEMKTFLLESQPGCSADTTTCARFEISSPKFIELDTAVQAAIDESIASLLSEALDGGRSKSTEKLASDFIADFNEFTKENPDFGLGWYFDARVKPLIATDTLISLQVDSEVFTGGAHGSYATQFVNVDPMRGTPYLLDALLKPGYEDMLARLAYEDFERQRGDEADSTGVSQDEGDQPFSLNDNYGFRKEGIVFFYNVYEIGAYAEGPTEILIPYERLEGWIK